MYRRAPVLFPNSTIAEDAERQERKAIKKLYAAFDKLERDRTSVSERLRQLGMDSRSNPDDTSFPAEAA